GMYDATGLRNGFGKGSIFPTPVYRGKHPGRSGANRGTGTGSYPGRYSKGIANHQTAEKEMAISLCGGCYHPRGIKGTDSRGYPTGKGVVEGVGNAGGIAIHS